MGILKFTEFSILEGGRAIKGASWLTKPEALEVATLVADELSKVPGIEGVETSIVGSLSGDLDRVSDVDLILHSSSGPMDLDETVRLLDLGWQTIPKKVSKGIGTISLAWEHSGKTVQVDLIPVSSKEWGEFVYKQTGQIKNAYRNSLLCAILAATPDQVQDGDTYRLMLRKPVGLVKAFKDRDELITNSPDKFCRMVLNATPDKVSTFEGALTAAKEKYPNGINNITNKLDNFLRRAGLDPFIPPVSTGVNMA